MNVFSAAAMAVLQVEQHGRSVTVYFPPSNSLLWWIVIGLLAGWIAGTVSRGRGFGCLADIILGLIGAVIGGWIFSKFQIPTYGFIGSLAAATVGAIVLVAVARLFSGSRD